MAGASALAAMLALASCATGAGDVAGATPQAAASVEAGQAASHQGKGWEKFTDAAVAAVAADPAPKVFILWGSHAQKKAANVAGLGAGSPHLILRAPHPSPLSAHNGFFGSRPFSQANAFLEAQGRGAIDWRLPDSPDA